MNINTQGQKAMNVSAHSPRTHATSINESEGSLLEQNRNTQPDYELNRMTNDRGEDRTTHGNKISDGKSSIIMTVENGQTLVENQQ